MRVLNLYIEHLCIQLELNDYLTDQVIFDLELAKAKPTGTGRDILTNILECREMLVEVIFLKSF